MNARALLLGMACAGAAASGCAAREQLLGDLKRASSSHHLPRVVACYERAFEAAGFKGEYDAVVSLTVAADTGAIRDAKVESMTTTGGEPAAELGKCVEAALNGSSLAAGGMRPAQDVRVVGMRVAFRDASEEARKDAAEAESNVLIGPRSDRCSGLYGYQPPRAAAEIFKELDDARGKASQAGKGDPDGAARALQRAYDLALELRERIALDAKQGDLPAESKKRLADLQKTNDKTAREIGAQIGCQPPGS